MKKSVYAAVLIAASASVAFTAQAQFAVTAVQSSKKAEKEQPVPTLSDPDYMMFSVPQNMWRCMIIM